MQDSSQTFEAVAPVLSVTVLVALLTWESISPCFSFFRQQGKERFFHGLINFGMSFLNLAITSLIFVSAWSLAVEFAAEHGLGLLRWTNWPGWSEAVLAIILLDCWTYWWHRLNHIVPFFWRFHRVHHSDTRMDVTTANRFHFGEIALSSMLRIPLLMLLGVELWHLALYELILFPVVQFHHANIRLPEPVDRTFRFLFASPAMHKVHHSDKVEETNSNYTSLLSIWDRIFGSFRLRNDLENIRLGLREFRGKEDQKFFPLLLIPSRKSGGNVKN
ncbi:MAG: sterol desaturase family protein [Verrucomicrobiales bacterium]|nr:sterol desaturase family protein [Verrucomicrobiales bacterium]